MALGKLFHKFFQNIGRSFTGRNLLLHFAAIFLTFIIVISGLDWFYFISARKDFLDAILFPAVAVGFFVPIFLPILILLLGKLRGSWKTMNTAWALWQSALLGLFISSIYKALTGRVQPDLSNTLVDISNRFQFGFWEHGIFWGWPSSHTTVAFAMAFALIALYPRNKFIKYFALAYALYVGIGVSINIHWLSEFVAGALIGAAIGFTVGKSFK